MNAYNAVWRHNVILERHLQHPSLRAIISVHDSYLYKPLCKPPQLLNIFRICVRPEVKLSSQGLSRIIAAIFCWLQKFLPHQIFLIWFLKETHVAFSCDFAPPVMSQKETHVAFLYDFAPPVMSQKETYVAFSSDFVQLPHSFHHGSTTSSCTVLESLLVRTCTPLSPP